MRKGRTPKKSAKKKAAPSTAAKKAKKKSLKKAASGKTKSVRRLQGAKRPQGRSGAGFAREVPESRSGEESGDLQGLSDVETADSESVDELIEEGNAFEAGVVSGVEDAENADESEVHTHEVPEDDVPAEYLDED
ncbi:MAG TPA: hypothetical protein VK706_08860 [Candidatus Sulfotelmatobacter sp.]|nr:hypothetical protein [Candidatus Sulfotelmatobacter sp.]